MHPTYTTLDNGMRIHMLTAGDDHLPPLVLLHGWPTNCHLWRHCIPALAQHYRVYAPDLPGYGLSDKPLDASYDLDYYVQFLLDFFAALDLKHVHLAAHDIGGLIGLGFAARHGVQLASFTVMDTAPYPDYGFLNRMLIRLMGTPPAAAWMLTQKGFAQSMRRFSTRYPDALTDDALDLFRATWIANDTSRLMFRQLVNVPAEQLTESRENLRRIAAPTLILWADNDPLFPPRVAEKLQRDIPHAELKIVKESGHFLQEEQPQQVIEHLLAFLSHAQAHPDDEITV